MVNIEELPTQDIQEVPLPSGVSDISITEEDQQISGPDAEIQQLQETMDSLDEVDKNLVIEHLTPEIVQVLGIIGGQAWLDFFSEFSDPNRLLIPVDRNKFLSGDLQGTQPQPDSLSLQIDSDEVSQPEEDIISESDLSTIL